MTKKRLTIHKDQRRIISQRFAKARNQYKNNASYRDFGKYVGVAHSTIQEIEAYNREPSYEVIRKMIAKFGGTFAYWLGEATCKNPDNEAIHNLTGLSEEAINKLREYKNYIDITEANMGDYYFDVAQRLQVLNYIIENIEHNGFCPDESLNTTDKNLLDNIYTFLFSDFDTKNTPNGYIYSRKIKIGDKQVSKGELLQKNEVRMIYLLNIQKNLNKMRDEIQQKEFETL